GAWPGPWPLPARAAGLRSVRASAACVRGPGAASAPVSPSRIAKSPEDLADQDGRRGFICEIIRRIDRQQSNALGFEQIMPGELHGQVARKPRRVLDQDYRRPVAEHVGEHGAKSVPLIYWVRTGHGRVVILLDDLKSVGLGIGMHGVPLTLLAILVGSDIPRA